MNIGTILNEIAQALASSGLTVYASVPDAGDFPALVVNPPTSIAYAERFNGAAELEVPVTLFVQTSDLNTSWQLVYNMLSTNLAGGTSVYDALRDHTPTNYRNVNVTTAGNFRPAGDNGIAVDLNLTIYTN